MKLTELEQKMREKYVDIRGGSSENNYHVYLVVGQRRYIIETFLTVDTADGVANGVARALAKIVEVEK